jgi:hypothetical protein
MKYHGRSQQFSVAYPPHLRSIIKENLFYYHLSVALLNSTIIL